MFINFNKDLKKQIKKTRKEVASRLGVTKRDVHLRVGDTWIEFSTPYDDTFCTLTVKSTKHMNLYDELNVWMCNGDVEWMFGDIEDNSPCNYNINHCDNLCEEPDDH